MSSELESEPYYHVPALDKGLDLLECLATRSLPLTQAQLARELDRRPTELFRMLTTLERRGYIKRDPDSGAYSLTLRLFELAHAHSPFDALIRSADRPMRNLAEETQQGCHLSVIERDRLLVIYQVESPARVRVSVEIGSTISLHRAASGRLLLAYLEEQECRELLERDVDYRELSESARSRIDSRLDRIRGRGFEEAYGESTRGLTDLAVLVGSPTGCLRTALAIAALPQSRGTFLQEMVEPMLRCAVAIGESAGLITPRRS